MQPKPHKAELEALTERELVNWLIQDSPHAADYRREGRRRAVDLKNPSIFTPPNGKHPKKVKHDPIHDDGDFYWRSDRVLAEDGNFRGAIEHFLKYAPEYWTDESKKTVEDVQSFLESILDRDLQYDDLSDSQKGWLGVIRRMHMEWVKEQESA